MSQKTYGDIRHLAKPYFDAEDAKELLEITRDELAAITACILQVPNAEASNWLNKTGGMLTAKAAGVAGSASLFGLVSTFGTAGTGTAIASLHGIAATNATLAAIGGSVAAGALVVTGFGLVVGFAAYKMAFTSARRKEDSLTNEDKRIVETCSLLTGAINEKLEREPLELYAGETDGFLRALTELSIYLRENADGITSRLDARNAMKFRQHTLRDFQPAVLDRWASYSKVAHLSSADIIGGVFYALITDSVIDNSPEQRLVLDALRRSKKSLNDASEAELSDYLDGLTPEQMYGVFNNVKGIYHEMLYVEAYNAENTSTYAELHPETNHAGADVIIRDRESNEIVAEVQLKATDNESYVGEHLERYPDITVLATSEVAEVMDGVDSSGLSNPEITNEMKDTFNRAADNTMEDRMSESAQLGSFLRGAFEASQVIRGKQTSERAAVNTLRAAASAAVSTGVVAFAIG